MFNRLEFFNSLYEYYYNFYIIVSYDYFKSKWNSNEVDRICFDEVLKKKHIYYAEQGLRYWKLCKKNMHGQTLKTPALNIGKTGQCCWEKCPPVSSLCHPYRHTKYAEREFSIPDLIFQQR